MKLKPGTQPPAPRPVDVVYRPVECVAKPDPANPGFHVATAYWLSPYGHFDVEARARGQERAIAMALELMAERLLKENPPCAT